MAFFKSIENKPSDRDILTNFVKDGKRISAHSFNKKVGQGSSKQDLLGEDISNCSKSD